MARRPPGPIFLERQEYRQSRVRDAIRFLPLAGAALWLVPLLWAPGSVGNAAALLYIFAVWAGLVAVAVALSLSLRIGPPPGQGPEAADPPGGSGTGPRDPA